MVKASGNPKTPQFATGALGAPKSNSANKSVTYGWSGRGDLNAPTPCAQDIGYPHLGINRFNNLHSSLVESCGNHQLQFRLNLQFRPQSNRQNPTRSPDGNASRKINATVSGGAHMLLRQLAGQW